MRFFLVFCSWIGFLEAQAACFEPLDVGHPCRTNQPDKGVIRWYFDQDHLKCYPFKYRGCGGNANNFLEQVDCWAPCVASFNENTCGYGIKPVGFCMNDPNRPKRDCLPSADCKMGYIRGICCPRDEMERAANPRCPNGKSPVKMNSHQSKISKSCDLDFCGPDETCVQGEFFAFCCLSKNREFTK